MIIDITLDMVRHYIPKRDKNGHKGTFGKVLCVCGSVGFTGAAVFASRSAMKMGCGLVYMVVPKTAWPIVAAKSDEAMAFPVDEFEGKISVEAIPDILKMAEKCDAVLIGCGLGLNNQIREIVDSVLDIDKPLIIDADGINALQGRENLLDKRADKVTILTPHEGEFLKIGDLSKGRTESTKEFAQKHGVHLVLKGHNTLIATPSGEVFKNTTGNSGMAKGGSGDVLSGMITSCIAQRLDPVQACISAVYMHGLAGDIAARIKTEYSMLPSDIIEYIPDAYKMLLNE